MEAPTKTRTFTQSTTIFKENALGMWKPKNEQPN
jgi:hypothetical protein